jgi:HD-GYP domain-containing protein (c-di-GMP phosphodiesterase class II)
MSSDIARHHHEGYDGSGYPDRLAGNSIPLAARIVALCDVYGALRSKRPHRPALSHGFAVELIVEGSPRQFDPNLLQAFRSRALQFDQIVREMPDA